MPKKRLRILFDAHPLLGQKTGVGYYTQSLVQSLATRYSDDVELVGYYHNFLYRKKTPDLPTAPNLSYQRVAFMPGQIVNLLRRFHILLPVEVLTFTRADFILYPNFLGLASLFNTPSASAIHDLTFIDLPEYVSRRNLHDLLRFIPAQIKRSSFLITVSEFSKQRIAEEFDVASDDILVTPIPPAPPVILSDDKMRGILKGMGLTGEYLLTLGTVEPRKNLLHMLDAYTRLPIALQRKYTFVVAGKIGWNCEAEQTRLAQLQKAGANVIHLGYVTDDQRAALYGGATLFTSASHYEGFGMPALEAMSYGTACALSDLPVFREVAGDSALYFNHREASSIAASWEQLLADDIYRKGLAERGSQHAQSYNWNDVAASVYDKIMQTLGERQK